MVFRLPCFVYTTTDKVSKNAAEFLISNFNFEKLDDTNKHFRKGEIDIIGVDSELPFADFLDIDTDFVIFLSRHASSKNIPSFTVHALGNWSNNTDLGGKPKTLGIASPKGMLSVLIELSRNKKIRVSYEATHHGPLINVPSLFAELGGNEETEANREYTDTLGRAVMDSVYNSKVIYGKVAIGIGSTHYPEKFTKLALEGAYAFSHILPKYHIKETDMIEQAINKSKPKADIAVIEWKSINNNDRNSVTKKLDELGMDYVKV